jgi:hypothetical protein
MATPIDIVKLVKDLPSRPRGRACIVFSQEYVGQKEWAAELARLVGADHLDLLDHFSANDDLAEKVSAFSVEKFFEFCRSKSSSKVLIISGLEFLKATWAAQPVALETFAHRVETWDQFPALLIIIQFDPILAKKEFKRFPQYLFLIDQKDTLSLP